MDMLCRYGWPGNVRHLQNIIRSAVILCPDEYISPEYVEPERRKGNRRKPQKDVLEIRIGETTMAEIEKCVIQKTLEYFGNNKTRAADALAITPRTIRNKLKRYRDDINE